MQHTTDDVEIFNCFTLQISLQVWRWNNFEYRIVFAKSYFVY